HEWSNLAAGMQAAYDQQLWATVIDYATTLTEAWFARGRYADARRGYQRSHAAAQALGNQPARATSLYHWAQACIEQSDYDEANEHLAASLELYGQSNDQSGIANVQSALARIATEHARYAEAEQLLATCQSIREQIGDVAGVAETLHRRACVRYYCGDYPEASALSNQSLSLQQALGNQSQAVASLRLLAAIGLHGTGDLESAERYCQAAQTISELLSDLGEIASTRYTRSEIYRRRGNFDAARAEAEKSLLDFRLIGDRRSQSQALFRLSLIDADLNALEEAIQEGQDSLGLCRKLQDRIGSMYVLKHLGDVYYRLLRSDHALNAWHEALNIAEALNHASALSLRERLAQGKIP
ncbi:MAG TPA: tetratricopeptide repeat protein, partial [Anaerolineae bacterium]|nr:tetratricopeptide repeat protein [Anaerolineae bacterium]